MADRSAQYVAAEAREFIRNDLQDKPNDLIREFAGLVEHDDTLQLLNYYAGLFEDEDDFLDSELARLILRNEATDVMDRAIKHGSISEMKGAVGLTKQRSESDGANLYADAANRLTMEGSICLVFGVPGSGKSSTTLDICQVWKAMSGGRIIANVNWQGADAHFNSDREMFEYMATHEGPVLALIDEVAQELSGFGSKNKQAEAFSNSLLHIRKRKQEFGPKPMKGSVIMVSHTRKKTAKSLREVSSFAVEKPSRNDPGRARLLDSEGESDEFHELQAYKGLTDTAETYDEYDPSDFEILVDGEEDEEAEPVDEDTLRREEAIKTAIKLYESNDSMTYEDVGEIVGYSRNWVGDRMKEYRNGELAIEIEV
ncbi:hypothetical protein [Halalkalirubrum salinum]|uniref:hypothetical protein n=1 Tax=Halalkalirubrum salinum TaxID=2563889 RepID=UPI0010FB7954|nr:hypothetical protein [Halalkalirubrum salinum]